MLETNSTPGSRSPMSVTMTLRSTREAALASQAIIGFDGSPLVVGPLMTSMASLSSDAKTSNQPGSMR